MTNILLKIIRWTLRRWCPGYSIYETFSDWAPECCGPLHADQIRELISCWLPSHHLAKNPPKGLKRRKKEVNE